VRKLEERLELNKRDEKISKIIWGNKEEVPLEVELKRGVLL